MRPKSMLLLALALGCGLVASIGINQYMQGQKEDPNAGANQSVVVVAAAEIPRGVLITDDKLTLKKWPADTVPAGALTDPQKVVGRVATQKLFPGDLVIEAKLAEEGKTRNIPDGMRLVTIKVNYWSVTSGFVRPDDRVDVIMVHQDVAQPILENVVVWAVDQDREHDATESKKPNAMGAQGVTLLVTARQAVMLALTQQQGQLWLSLRSETDSGTGELEKMNLAEVLRGRSQSGSQGRDSDTATTPDQRLNTGITGILNGLSGESASGDTWRMKIMVGSNVIEEREYQLSPAE
jgi:pilus assembly protein CpaB